MKTIGIFGGMFGWPIVGSGTGVLSFHRLSTHRLVPLLSSEQRKRVLSPAFVLAYLQTAIVLYVIGKGIVRLRRQRKDPLLASEAL